MKDDATVKIKQAIKNLQQGKMVILVDDESRENEGDLVLAAEFVDSKNINFMLQNAGGFICLAMDGESLDRLQIPMMVQDNRSLQGTPFTVSIEAATGVTTGVSVDDRVCTIKAATNPNSKPADIVTPGHIFPLRADANGVLAREGHTEGSVDLMRLAGLRPSTVICEIMNADGSMARGSQLQKFAEQYSLPMVSVNDLIHYRLQHEQMVELVATANLPVKKYGEFKISTFRNKINQAEHLALVKKAPCNNSAATNLVRIHSECLTGDVFGSTRCDCGEQLDMALARISEQGGVLLYLKQEGRGIGLTNKIKAYELQEQGLDTVEANKKLGFSADQRDYWVAAQMLLSMHIKQIHLLTNNPNKIEKLQEYGIKVLERIALESEPNINNIRYLQTKRDKLGHLLSQLRLPVHDNT